MRLLDLRILCFCLLLPSWIHGGHWGQNDFHPLCYHGVAFCFSSGTVAMRHGGRDQEKHDGLY